jgi:polypyrimidine tract-binding protein 2
MPQMNMPLATTPVLIVSGLDQERILPDQLFTLFGVYGDVIRVKILHNKRDTALIQFTSPQQAETALSHLNGCPLYGGTLRVNFSKHNSISLPRPTEGQEHAHLTKDFTGSPLHRYKVIGSRNYQHICPPSPVLHISNIPESTTENTVRELFSQSGTITGLRFFPRDRKMALVQMSTVSEAVEALINTHNSLLDGANIRVSFSKSNV